jgi:hypothetical protein
MGRLEKAAISFIISSSNKNTAYIKKIIKDVELLIGVLLYQLSASKLTRR